MPPSAKSSSSRFASRCETSCGPTTTIAPSSGSLRTSCCWTSACAGRQVDEEVVELAPVRLVHELAEHAAPIDNAGSESAWSSPTRNPIDISCSPCTSTGGSEIGRPSRQSCSSRRALAPREPDHQRDVGAVEVGVEHADVRAVARESEGEIERQRRLADAALPARDRDDDGGGRLRLSP